MSGDRSPAGDRHPGEIVHDDRVSGEVETWQANEVPQSVAWVEVEDAWVPVVRIERTGTEESFEIISYGPGGRFLQVMSASG